MVVLLPGRVCAENDYSFLASLSGLCCLGGLDLISKTRRARVGLTRANIFIRRPGDDGFNEYRNQTLVASLSIPLHPRWRISGSSPFIPQAARSDGRNPGGCFRVDGH